MVEAVLNTTVVVLNTASPSRFVGLNTLNHWRNCMSFIRVTDLESGVKIDINSDHILSFTPSDTAGSIIRLLDGNLYSVKDTPRSIRGFIKKAQGNLPTVPPEMMEA